MFEFATAVARRLNHHWLRVTWFEAWMEEIRVEASAFSLHLHHFCQCTGLLRPYESSWRIFPLGRNRVPGPRSISIQPYSATSVHSHCSFGASLRDDPSKAEHLFATVFTGLLDFRMGWSQILLSLRWNMMQFNLSTPKNRFRGLGATIAMSPSGSRHETSLLSGHCLISSQVRPDNSIKWWEWVHGFFR